MGFLWITDLSKPDRSIDFGTELPWPVEGYLNVLPLCMVVTMLIQQLMAPKPVDPQQQQQQKMMKFMMIGFGVMFYTVPAGLVLYFLFSSLVGIFESRLIKKQLAREDEKDATA
jgi:YidC/Oxa1 family membrane protein insertase